MSDKEASATRFSEACVDAVCIVDCSETRIPADEQKGQTNTSQLKLHYQVHVVHQHYVHFASRRIAKKEHHRITPPPLGESALLSVLCVSHDYQLSIIISDHSGKLFGMRPCAAIYSPGVKINIYLDQRPYEHTYVKGLYQVCTRYL